MRESNKLNWMRLFGVLILTAGLLGCATMMEGVGYGLLLHIGPAISITAFEHCLSSRGVSVDELSKKGFKGRYEIKHGPFGEELPIQVLETAAPGHSEERKIVRLCAEGAKTVYREFNEGKDKSVKKTSDKASEFMTLIPLYPRGDVTVSLDKDTTKKMRVEIKRAGVNEKGATTYKVKYYEEPALKWWQEKSLFERTGREGITITLEKEQPGDPVHDIPKQLWKLGAQTQEEPER